MPGSILWAHPVGLFLLLFSWRSSRGALVLKSGLPGNSAFTLAVTYRWCANMGRFCCGLRPSGTCIATRYVAAPSCQRFRTIVAACWRGGLGVITVRCCTNRLLLLYRRPVCLCLLRPKTLWTHACDGIRFSSSLSWAGLLNAGATGRNVVWFTGICRRGGSAAAQQLPSRFMQLPHFFACAAVFLLGTFFCVVRVGLVLTLCLLASPFDVDSAMR